MFNARRLALVIFVMGVLGLSIGLTTPRTAGPSGGTVIAAVAPETAVSTDVYVGQEGFSTAGPNQICRLCFSLPCEFNGAPCGGGGGDPNIPDRTSCTCKTCNGQFNCWQ